jgi:hypothetical protein
MKDHFVIILDNISRKEESVVLRDCNDLINISSGILDTSLQQDYSFILNG